MIHYIFHNLFSHLDVLPRYFFAVARAAAEQAPQAGHSGNVTELLGIDWKLFIAQLINFGIVLFILWKWVFKPLSQKLEERSQKIERSMRQVAEIEQQHKLAEDNRIAEAGKAMKLAAEIIAKAEAVASQAKAKILDEARMSAEKMLAQASLQLADEKAKLIREVREQAAEMVVIAAEKIIREKLDDKKDREIIRDSLKNI